MYNDTIIDRQLAVKNIVSALSTGINSWLDKVSILAISTPSANKLNDIQERLHSMKSSLYSKEYKPVIAILATDAIIDDPKDLNSLSNNDIKYYLKQTDTKVINKIAALEEYIDDRSKRLNFLKTPEGLFKVSKFSDLRSMLDKLYTSIENTKRREVCSYLANEAAFINRNISNMEFKDKTVLQDMGRNIVRKSVFKCRLLSV